jgi:BppU N-terminal domain
MDSIQKGAIGVDIVLTVTEDGAALNIASATGKKIILGKPDGTRLEKEAAFVSDGSDGKIKYTTIAGDLDAAGVWQAQAEFTLSGFTGRGTMTTFEVKPNIEGDTP